MTLLSRRTPTIVMRKTYQPTKHPMYHRLLMEPM